MTKAIIPLYSILKLNTRLYKNCLKGIDIKLAGKRPNNQINNIGFIACHLNDVRHYLAHFIGIKIKSSEFNLWNNVDEIDQFMEIPPIEEIINTWLKISKSLAKRFNSITTKELNEEAFQNFPIEDHTILGGITFLLQHESYHIGQMALLRKYFGLPPMGYL